MTQDHNCEPMRLMNEHLSGYNTMIERPFVVFGPSRCLVSTVKIDIEKRGKPKSAFASFCPLCGEKYQE